VYEARKLTGCLKLALEARLYRYWSPAEGLRGGFIHLDDLAITTYVLLFESY
jgi:hypothetical protein